MNQLASRQQGQVESQLGSLASSIDVLIDKVTALTNRVDVCLAAPLPPEEKNKKDQEKIRQILCALADSIRCQDDRIQCLSVTLDDIIARIEL